MGRRKRQRRNRAGPMVTWREAGADDRSRVTDWLLAHQRGPIFALSNLLADGLITDSDAGDHAMQFWIGDDWAGLIGYERGGMILPQLGKVSDLTGLRDVMKGIRIAGIIGEADQVTQTLAALDLDAAPKQLDVQQLIFDLQLGDLQMPDVGGRSLKRFQPEDDPLLHRWFADYNTELQVMTATNAARTAPERIARFRRSDTHRLLWQGDQPVAMTGINAQLPGLVQIGGVYCPPALRNRGFARTAVALHLAELRAKQVTQATLFAASEIAARAYRAIGFRQSGLIRIVILCTPQDLSP